MQNIERNATNSDTGEVGIACVVPRFATSGPVKIITPHGEVITSNITVNGSIDIP